MAKAWFGGRVLASRRTALLAIGDYAMVALFVVVGEFRHNGTVAAGLETFAQFGVGWLLVAILAGVYARDALSGTRRAVLQAVGTWVLAALVAQLIRLLLTPGSLVQPTFVLVSISFGGLFIGIWRALAVRAVGAA